jgi:molybdate transport system permease protein
MTRTLSAREKRAEQPSPRRSLRARLPRGPGGPVSLVVLGCLGALLFVLPLAGLLLEVPWATAMNHLASPIVLDALSLSLLCSVLATIVCLVFGIPLAWIQVRMSFPGRSLLRIVTTLPVVLPPVVGGVALLLVFGRKGLIGEPLYELTGIQLPFTMAGTVMAEAFVAMPFLVLTIAGALQSMDHRLEDAARTLAASRWTVFWRVTLPSIRPSLLAGTVLCWARALGEFGATITFAGNFPGKTQTLPLAVYVALETDLDAAITLSVLLLVISLTILISLRKHWVGMR